MRLDSPFSAALQPLITRKPAAGFELTCDGELTLGRQCPLWSLLRVQGENVVPVSQPTLVNRSDEPVPSQHDRVNWAAATPVTVNSSQQAVRASHW